MAAYTSVPQYYTWPYPDIKRNYIHRQQAPPSTPPDITMPMYVHRSAASATGPYGYLGFVGFPNYRSVPDFPPTTEPESPQGRSPLFKGCSVCQELESNTRDPPLNHLWKSRARNADRAKRRVACWKPCYEKDRKDLVIRVYIVMLVQLLLSSFFCIVFRFGMLTEIDEIRKQRPWLEWLPMFVYILCCLTVFCFPNKVFRQRSLSYLLVIAITYCMCFGSGRLALDYFWEVFILLLCCMVILMIIIVLLLCMPVDEVISPIGFVLTQALLLIFYGFTTFIFKYVYFIPIRTLCIVYLITLLIPLYILMDTWFILEGRRLYVQPAEPVMASSVTLSTDVAIMPALFIIFKRPCSIEIDRKCNQQEK